MIPKDSNIVIAGGTGLVGNRLIKLLNKAQATIYILTRSKKQDTDTIKYIVWDIEKQEIDCDQMPKTYALINLVGAGIADKRWTSARKKELIDSRVKSTEFLAKLYADAMPTVYVGASAIGYYGDRGSEELTAESQPAKGGFLTECCLLWEEASRLFEGKVEHFYILRIGIVLSNLGGALPSMRLPAKLGGAGYFGDGKAYYSWIHITDLCQMFVHLLDGKSPSGVYNGTAPNPVTIKTLMRGIKASFAPYALLLPIPEFLIKLGAGEMATMLTNSTKVLPTKMSRSGFSFAFSEIEPALDYLRKHKEI
jgi:uncharacterized protein